MTEARKITGLILALTCAMAAVAVAAEFKVTINGTIRNVHAIVFGEKATVMFTLKGRSENYYLSVADAAKYGMLKPETAAASPDKGRMQRDLDGAIGWKVRLTIEPRGEAKEQQYSVKNLQRLP